MSEPTVCGRCGRVGAVGSATFQAERGERSSRVGPRPLCPRCMARMLRFLDAPNRVPTTRPRSTMIDSGEFQTRGGPSLVAPHGAPI